MGSAELTLGSAAGMELHRDNEIAIAQLFETVDKPMPFWTE